MLIVFDGNFMLHRSLMLPDVFNLEYAGKPTGGVYGVIRALHDTLSAYGKIDRRIVVWDGQKSERRLKLYPDYKGNRAPKTDQEKHDKEAYFKVWNIQKTLLNEILPTLGFLPITFAKKEADDVIYQIVKLYHNKEDVLVVSEDSDMVQLITHFPSVKVYQPIKKQVISKDNFKEVVGVPVETFIYHKAMMGDKTDNIKGVNGVGEITSQKYLSQVDVKDVNNSLYSIASKANEKFQESKGKKGIRDAKLFRGWGTLARNLELVDLSREPFLDSELQVLSNVINSFVVKVYDECFRNYCVELGFRSILDRFDVWIAPFKNLGILDTELLRDLQNEIDKEFDGFNA